MAKTAAARTPTVDPVETQTVETAPETTETQANVVTLVPAPEPTENLAILHVQTKI